MEPLLIFIGASLLMLSVQMYIERIYINFAEILWLAGNRRSLINRLEARPQWMVKKLNTALENGGLRILLAGVVGLNLSTSTSHSVLAKVRTWIQRQCSAGGYPAGLIVAEWLVLAIAGAIAGLLVLTLAPAPISFVGLILIVLAPSILFLAQREYRMLLQAPLSDWFLTQSLFLSSGMDVQRSFGLSRIGVEGPLANELAQVHFAVQTGATLDAAFDDMARRTELAIFAELAAALETNRRFGGAIGPVFRTTADRLRVLEEQRAEKTALETPVRILPAMLIIFVLIFVLLMAPVASMWTL